MHCFTLFLRIISFGFQFYYLLLHFNESTQMEDHQWWWKMKLLLLSYFLYFSNEKKKQKNQFLEIIRVTFSPSWRVECNVKKNLLTLKFTIKVNFATGSLQLFLMCLSVIATDKLFFPFCACSSKYRLRVLISESRRAKTDFSGKLVNVRNSSRVGRANLLIGPNCVVLWTPRLDYS